MTNRQINTEFALERGHSEYMDGILGHAFPVLDHGHIRIIDYYGDDDAIAEAARVSYQKGTKKLRDNEGLVRYLLSHNHSTPFEMASIKLHIRLPIQVMRQHIRHRVWGTTEASARYSVLPKEFYIPEPENLAPQSKSNRQGREDDGTYTDEVREEIRDRIRTASEDCYEYYEELMDKHDLSRELARSVLPVNIYTEAYQVVNLKNLLDYLSLRTDSHAQYEIRVYAEKIAEIVEGWVPATYKAWVDYKRDAVSLSRMEKTLLQRILKRHLPDHFRLGPEDFPSDMTIREARDFVAKFPALDLKDFG